MPKILEKDFAKKVISWLVADDWEVYQEVQPLKYTTSVIDIVAKRGPIVWLIETKLSFNFDVLAQAKYWKGYSHLQSIAVPNTRTKTKNRDLGFWAANALGIGALVFSAQGNCIKKTFGDFGKKPMLLDELNAALVPEHKTFAEAGSRGGKYFTPFKQTVIELKKYLQEHPGSSMPDIIEHIKHHYANDRSARCTIARWIQKGIISGIRQEHNGKILKYYLENL